MIAPFLVDEHRPLWLASGSPRRRELLEAVGIPVTVRPFDVDETRRADETVDAYLERIAHDKLFAALDAFGVETSLAVDGPRAVLAADTVVVLDGEPLGKPKDARDAVRMLGSLSGRSHEVRTRFAIGVAHAAGGSGSRGVHAETVATRVVFRRLDSATIDRYVATGEGADKAGAYAIQGIGGFAVQRIDGSYTNVVGLPVCEVIQALEAHRLIDRFPLGTRDRT